jgi:hypothetical protein
MNLLEEALRRCEAHFQRSGRHGHWALFEARVLQPAVHRTRPPPLSELAEAAGFPSPALAAAAVQGVKRRVVALFREVVAETVEDGANVDAELEAVCRRIESR